MSKLQLVYCWKNFKLCQEMHKLKWIMIRLLVWSFTFSILFEFLTSNKHQSTFREYYRNRRIFTVDKLKFRWFGQLTTKKPGILIINYLLVDSCWIIDLIIAPQKSFTLARERTMMQWIGAGGGIRNEALARKAQIAKWFLTLVAKHFKRQSS